MCGTQTAELQVNGLTAPAELLGQTSAARSSCGSGTCQRQRDVGQAMAGYQERRSSSLLLSPPYPRQPGIAAEFTHTHTRADEGETATTGNLHTAALAFNFTFLMGERLQ